jgi:hypothetical protein
VVIVSHAPQGPIALGDTEPGVRGARVARTRPPASWVTFRPAQEGQYSGGAHTRYRKPRVVPQRQASCRNRRRRGDAVFSRAHRGPVDARLARTATGAGRPQSALLIRRPLIRVVPVRAAEAIANIVERRSKLEAETLRAVVTTRCRGVAVARQWADVYAAVVGDSHAR